MPVTKVSSNFGAMASWRLHFAASGALYASRSWVLSGASALSGHCWTDCANYGLFCPEYCCAPNDGVGNTACWDNKGHFSFQTCCADLPMVTDPEPDTLTASLGSLRFELYRGPSEHNSPKVNERTVEVALGLWFMRRSLARTSGGAKLPLELGNVLGHYWPAEDRLAGHYLPWQLADLGANGEDATSISFEGRSLLSLSTVEHVGHDNEGVAHVY
eukprot:s650_g3.t1